MNKKLIAVAVASTFAVPVVAQAEATWYGRINTAIAITDADDAVGGDRTDVRNVSSRFGVHGTHDLGNGLSGIYRYEFGVASDVADVQDNNRLSFVGLSGAFGTVTIGRVWSAFFNHIGTIMDVSQNVGGDGYNGPYRTSDTLSYANSFGPLALQVDAIMEGDNEASSTLDEVAIAGTLGAGPLSIAAGYRDKKGDGAAVAELDQIGIAARYSLDGFWLGAGYTSIDDGTADDTTGMALLAGGGAGDISWWVSLENLEDDDAGIDTDVINFNVGKVLGPGMRVYIEGALNDTADGDVNELLLGIRADF
jgi:predicted porin